MGRLTTIATAQWLASCASVGGRLRTVARLGTDDAAMAVEVRGGRAVTAWPPLESTALRVFAFLAPTVFGSVLAAVWLLTGFEPTPWRVLFAVGLAIYTIPSPADIRGACGLQEVQQETHNQ